MTRKEALEELFKYQDFEDLDWHPPIKMNACLAENFVHEIYNDIELRTCENCVSIIGKDKTSRCSRGYLPDNLYENEFYCNYWEER